jgi:hypothetical protein
VAVLLLERGADPNARNWDDVTPLHQAVRARNLAVAEVLLGRGADPNARDKIRGSTPLRRAVSATGAGGTAGTAALMVPLTRLLLAHGADPEARDKRGVPVHASARAPEVRAVLEEHRRGTRGKAGSRAAPPPARRPARSRTPRKRGRARAWGYAQTRSQLRMSRRPAAAGPRQNGFTGTRAARAAARSPPPRSACGGSR